MFVTSQCLPGRRVGVVVKIYLESGSPSLFPGCGSWWGDTVIHEVSCSLVLSGDDDMGRGRRGSWVPVVVYVPTVFLGVDRCSNSRIVRRKTSFFCVD